MSETSRIDWIRPTGGRFCVVNGLEHRDIHQTSAGEETIFWCCWQKSLTGDTCIPTPRADSPVSSVLNYLFNHTFGTNRTIHIVFSLGQMPAIPTAYYQICWPDFRSTGLLFCKTRQCECSCHLALWEPELMEVKQTLTLQRLLLPWMITMSLSDLSVSYLLLAFVIL